MTHNRPDLLKRTLQTIADAHAPPEFIELIVIENGAADCGSKEVAESLGVGVQIKFLYVANRGASLGRNTAVRCAEADFICLFDDDVRLEKQAISAYCCGARKYGPGHYFGGPFGVDAEGPAPEWLVPYLPYSATGWQLGTTERPIYPDMMLTGCGGFGAFREDLLSVGGYPEYLGITQHYRAIGEETFLQKRLIDAGLRGIYLPDAKVWHFVPAERCSYVFALRRAHIVGATQTLASFGERGIPFPKLPPRWMYRRWIQLYLLTNRSRLLGRPPPERIKGDYAFARHCGLMDGYRIARRHLPAAGSSTAGAMVATE